MSQAQSMRERARRLVIYLALLLVLALLVLDRSAAWLYRPDAGSTSVIIYTTAWCGYCTALRAHLDAHGIPYTDHDIEASIEGSMGYWALRGRGVPISVIGPEVVHGFNLESINRSLAALGFPVEPAATGAAPATHAPSL